MDKELTETFVVDTPSGRLEGLRKGIVASFKGIPFAKPPLGSLRWRAPEPLEPWTGMRDATRFAPGCPQAPTQVEALMGMTVGDQSEDCLYLNVWTPACDGAKRPVMVWVHGGAFVLGAGSHGIYDGQYLAAQDVVVVTINYRLGAFGFLTLGALSEGRIPGSGAEGIADQILALDWVKRNIAQFGGDPQNVTIFGESAGAMSVALLLASPLAKGLFHKAILQSGAAHLGHSIERAQRVALAFLEELRLGADEAEKAAAAPYSALIAAQISLLAKNNSSKDARGLSMLPFQPTIEGDIVPAKPVAPIRNGAAKNIPILIGTTKDEYLLFTAAAPQLRLMSARSFAERVERVAAEHASLMLETYGEGSPFERFNAFMTDKVFAVPAARLAEAQSKVAPVYAYRFDWHSNFLGGIMGACHALELGFVFGTHAKGLGGAFFGSGATAEALSRDMMGAWAAFARTGNPATAETGLWPCFEPERRPTMIFGAGAPHVRNAPDFARIRAWDGIAENRIGV